MSISTSTTDHEHAELNCETCIDRWLWTRQDA